MSSPQLSSPRESEVAAAIRRVRSSALVGYWPQDDPAGSIKAKDLSGLGHNGANTNVLTGKQGGFGRPAYYWDGTGDYSNIYSTTLAAFFSPLAGTLLCFLACNAAAYADGIVRTAINLGADTSNFVKISKNSTVNTLLASYTSGGVGRGITMPAKAECAQMLGITWNKTKDEVRVFLNGAQYDQRLTGLSNWSGALANTRCVLGAQTTAGANGWLGYTWDTALYREALHPSEIYKIWMKARGMNRRWQ